MSENQEVTGDSTVGQGRTTGRRRTTGRERMAECEADDGTHPGGRPQCLSPNQDEGRGERGCGKHEGERPHKPEHAEPCGNRLSPRRNGEHA